MPDWIRGADDRSGSTKIHTHSMVPWPSALSRTTLPWRISWVFTVEICRCLSCSGSGRRHTLGIRAGYDRYNSLCIRVLPVSITRLCCLWILELLLKTSSTGRSEGISGRGSDFGSSGVMAESLNAISRPFSLRSPTEVLQGRKLIGCPLRPMYLPTGRPRREWGGRTVDRVS